MKIITINSPKHGVKEVFVDDEDYGYLIQFVWCIFKSRQFVYAMRTEPMVKGVKGKMILMHRELMKSERYSKVQIDHADHNTLNNQKLNLRKATMSQNQANKTPRGRSKYLGVWYNRNSIVSKIRIKGVQITIGQGYKTEEEAARAYDKKAKEVHGEFANLNFKE